MLKHLRSFALAAAMLLPFAVQAQSNTLTVYDGAGTATTNNYVPAYIYYFDAFTRSQVVYPASELAEMNTGVISEIKFYTTSSNVPYTTTCNVDVYIKEVSYTTISAFEPKVATDIVYSGTLDVVASGDGGEMTITLTTPYTYSGGNLLIGIENIAKGQWKNIYFHGETVSGASVSGNNSSSLDGVSAGQKNFIPKTTFTYTGGTVISCQKVTNLTASSIAATSVDLSWVDANNTGATYSILNGTDVLASGITTTYHTLTGLTANTPYTLSVVANCSPTDESAPLNVTFRTACDALSTLPYTCGFEGSERPEGNFQVPYCWTKYNGGISNYPYAYSGNAHTGSNSLYFYYATYGTYPDTMIAVLPAIDVATLPMNTLRLRFYGRGNYSGIGGDLLVGTMSDPSDPSTFTLVETVSISGSTYGSDPFVLQDFPATTDQYIALAFVHGTSMAAIYLDDITLDLKPNCLAVDGLTVTDFSQTDAHLTWNGTAGEYNVIVSNGLTTVYDQVLTTNTAWINGLAAETNYFVSVRAICNGVDTSEVTSTSFYTGYCLPNPYSRDAQGITSVEFGGMTNDATHPSVAPFYGNYYTMSGSVPAGLPATVNITYQTGYTYGTVIWVDWNNNIVFDDDEVVYTGESSEDNPTTLVATFDVPATQAPGSYRMRIAGADSYFDDSGTPNPCFSSSYAVAEDYTLIVTEAPNCLPVSDLVAIDSLTTSSSLTLSWVSDGAGFTVLDMADSSVLGTTTDTFYVVSGLTANTAYTFGVYVNCTGENSDTTSVVVNTACDVFAAPYTYGFEEVSEFNCWSIDGPAMWVIGTGDHSSSTGAHSGNNNAKITHSVNGYATKLISPVLVLDPAETYRLNFWHVQRAWGNDQDELTVYYRTAPDAAWQQLENYNTNISTWQQEQIVLPNPSATYQIAFEMLDSWGYGVAVDDVEIAPVPLYTVAIATLDATKGSVEPAGDSTVLDGTDFTATATPVEGYHFVAWMSGTDTVSTVNPFTFTVSSDTNISALFEINTYTVSIATADAAMGSVEPAGDSVVDYGTSFTATATPEEGYHFVAWMNGTDTVSTVESVTFNVYGDTSLTAVFDFNPYTVTLASADTAMGSVEPAGDTVVLFGNNITATATAAYGYSFVAWMSGTDTVSTDNPLTITVMGDTSLTAYFEMKNYTVSLDVNDANMGSINPMGDTVMQEGSTLTVVATAADSCRFIGWRSNGTIISTEETLTLEVDADYTITALFEVTPVYTVTLYVKEYARPRGSVSDGAVKMEGESFTATASPDAGCYFVAWVNDNGDTLSYNNPYTFTVTSDITLVAILGEETHTVAGEAVDAEMGEVYVVKGRVRYGDTDTLLAQANEGYRFVRWEDGTTDPYLVITVTSDTVVKAYFEAIPPIGIDETEVDAATVYSVDNKIVVRGAEGRQVFIFDVNGRCVAHKDNVAVSEEFVLSATGVYLVKVGIAPAKRVVVVR